MVHAVNPLQSGGAQPAAVTTPLVKPALPQSAVPAGMWMVQIAAVSHPEDAEVLVNALRKHVYAVAVHRDPADTLMHVQVGPFASHTDAAAMRQKLLTDGYNAIVQP
jgi:DedD protein